MHIEHTCVRCRRVNSTVDIRGGIGGAHPLMSRLAMPTFDRGICVRCGGEVYAVKDGEVLPYEFIASAWRTLIAACVSAVKVALVWLPFAFVILQPTAEGGSQGTGMLPGLLRFTGVAALCGFTFPWAQALVARRQGVNKPHAPGTMPSGEAATLFTFVVPALATAIVLFLYVIPALIGDRVALRGVFVRVLCGFLTGVTLLGITTRETFRRGRRPPPGDERRLRR
jgi:hypothetical protein